MKALIVDDSASSLAYHCALVSSLGLDCVSATSGEEALRRYQEQHFDFILLDVEMPSGHWSGLRNGRPSSSSPRSRMSIACPKASKPVATTT